MANLPRNQHPIEPGQLWQLSDPRRLSIFKVLAHAITGDGQPRIYARVIFPIAPGRHPVVILDRAKFEQIGSKGYSRVR